MTLLTELLTGMVSQAFIDAGYPSSFGTVTASDRPDLCQFQCSGAFSCAKVCKKAPLLIAGEVADKLFADSVFSTVQVAGNGFINLNLSDNSLLEYTGQVLSDPHLGVPQAEHRETVFLDYGGPNVAKPLHIGHLRSAVIGEALKRIARATGRRTVSDVHLGDWGLQMGLVIAELKERCPGYFAGEAKELPLSSHDLNEIYPFASKKSKENAAFKAEAQRITAELQKGNPVYKSLWEQIVTVSVADMKRSYKRLGVSFDLWKGESDAEQGVASLVELLSQQGLLYESEGAMVVDVSENADKVSVPPVIIKKSDASSIYATTDLATLMERQRDFAPNQLWYVVDQRQSLHFTQVFRCAKKAGLVPAKTVLEHLGFGTMNGTDGRPYKTRDGGVMPLSELYDTVYTAALTRLAASGYSTEAEKKEIAEKITVAAIKFGDLINHRSKDYVFDIDRFLASDGKTGTFLLYTIARVNSILKKAGAAATLPATVYTPAERELLLKLSLSGEVFQNAYREKAPNFICENAYQLASAFSRFYHDHHILTEQDQNKQAAWLFLCGAVKKMLMKHLEVLGIEAVEFM